MTINGKLYKSIWCLSACLLFIINNGQVLGNLVNRQSGFSLDITGCALYHKLCSQFDDDLGILSCALNASYNKTQIPAVCQHKIWTHQAKLANTAYLNHKLRDTCHDEAAILNCLNPTEFGIDCVLKKKSSVRNKNCWWTINKIESLIFNDWQLIGNFLKNCNDDIEAHTCGRIPLDPKSLSQSQTLRCLHSSGINLRSECLAEITVLQEMKYGNLQLDKLIFAACNLDQKKFCPDDVSGSWLMYKCLLRHKYENGMRKKCQDQLFYDQRNIVMNYKMSRGLVKSCKEDIRKYHCRKGVADDKDVRLAQILLCLENVSKNESTKLSHDCMAEMIDHRNMLMDDYRLSPELMQNCANDITKLCRGIEVGGKTIHCLMDHARPRKRKDKRTSLECQKSLEALVQEADPGEDWRVDPILHNACNSVVDKACREVNNGNGRVMSCLMEKLGTTFMTNECEAALLQIQYFISRNYKLDPQLYRACKYDAVTLCKAKLQWADLNEQQPDQYPQVLPCLYNHAYNTELGLGGRLKPGCEQQVRRVMRQRAISVDLMPEIEDLCMEDLITFCFEHTGKGEEITCLQNNIKELKPKCKEIVTNFTETQSGHIELNAVVNNNCRVPIERLCSSELKSKKGEDDIMECLIMHKNNPEIKANPNCRVAIEHEQLISLKNYRFTRKFKNACRPYVTRYCPKAQTKNRVVACLSEIVRNDTISKNKHSILKECRQQLRQQLFQQKENIDLDPELKDACKDDLEAHCLNVPHGESAALECLQTAKEILSVDCRKALFILRKQEFTDNAIDYHLITSCNDMIDLYCHNTDASKMLDCLKAHRQEPDFDDNCNVVIVNRMIEQNMDYRFNNNLQNACKTDIVTHCSNIIAHEPEVELMGKMLDCLKDKFRKFKLSKSCENELADILKEQALNHRLNPLLEKMCSAEIQTICPVSKDITNSDGQVEECLKNALMHHKIVSSGCASEVANIIEETEVDIEVDPLLQRACALDLLKHCKNLDHGAGRRLKCLEIILYDDSRKLEAECEKALSSRLEMYRHIAMKMNGMGDVYNGMFNSPSKKYFIIVILSSAAFVFVFGLYCGKISKHAMYVKTK